MQIPFNLKGMHKCLHSNMVLIKHLVSMLVIYMDSRVIFASLYSSKFQGNMFNNCNLCNLLYSSLCSHQQLHSLPSTMAIGTCKLLASNLHLPWVPSHILISMSSSHHCPTVISNKWLATIALQLLTMIIVTSGLQMLQDREFSSVPLSLYPSLVLMYLNKQLVCTTSHDHNSSRWWVGEVQVQLHKSVTGLSTGVHLRQEGSGRYRSLFHPLLHNTGRNGEFTLTLESPTKSRYQFRALLACLPLHSSL